ncbi:uncharacterized protein PITG_00252 [Phytophthora infestans T30-4]|uniref:Uncharacterized protein n=2 Tax=Phytophthora infestans TaxID=4787 RepID=D0MQB8_PHYIT|nr:uncharacterized protein PITG_00252 [Phytophthora infestans T30-4]EEY57687.1 conserved hypothetical protein [Phytophthora infestans T30-4]|eukprot:XP_002908873.1 conserved hypothetical protein [Phytophthora infestans T30-4]
MGEQKTEETQQGKVEEVEMEMQEESLEPEKQEHEKTQEEKTPVKAATPSEKKKPSQATSASKSATKRKFDALHARNAPSIPEHEKNKKARASALMKTPGAKLNEKKAPTKTREFSFARPTESSASRTTAIAKDHGHPKTTPTPPPARKPLHPKNTPAKAQHTSAAAPKTPTDKTSRPHFSYTPYTGPLPPLTVESSFAPKGSQNTSHKLPASARKPRPASAKKTRPQSSTGKENNGVNTDGDAATNAASSSKVNHRDEGADPVGV